jgi:hypothetical protein
MSIYSLYYVSINKPLMQSMELIEFVTIVFKYDTKIK